MKRTILSIVTALVLVFCITVHAESGEFSRLGELKIIQGDQCGNWNLDKPVTRAELMQFAVNSLNLRNVTANHENVNFSDMKDHWASNTVNLALEMKLIEKQEFFNPEDTVTMADTIKIIVKILGYEPMAQSNGGDPIGYITTATSIGLTNNLTFSQNSTALRRDVAKLLENALDIPVMVQTGYNGEHKEFKIADGKDGEMRTTLLSLFE